MFFKVQDIINIRTAELIDRLVIITNDTQVLILSGKNTDQFKLCRIRILLLVHHNIAEAFLIVV